MSYKTLMVCCDLNAGNDNRLHITASLAERFDARVIGIAAESEVIPVNLAESDAFSNVDMWEVNQPMSLNALNWRKSASATLSRAGQSKSNGGRHSQSLFPLSPRRAVRPIS